MHVLDFVVLKQLITYKPCRPLIADSVGHVYASFSLDEEWDNLAVTAVFRNNSISNPVEVLLTEGRIKIPPEVLVDGHLFVSLVGTGDNGNVCVPTASMSRPVRVYRSGDLVGVAPDQRTPAIWAQALSAIGPLSKLDTKNKNNLVAAINEVLSASGEPGYSPVRGVDYWTQADKAAIVADTLAALPTYNGEVV